MPTVGETGIYLTALPGKYIYVSIYIYIYTHTYIYAYICESGKIYLTKVCMYICMCIYIIYTNICK